MGDGKIKQITVHEKKRGQSLFQSFKPVIKCDNLNSNPKEEVWQRMVGNYKDQEGKARAWFPFSAVSQ